jgi:hypothetical protein
MLLKKIQIHNILKMPNLIMAITTNVVFADRHEPNILNKNVIVVITFIYVLGNIEF